MRKRMGYLKVVPWLLVHACEQEAAIEIVRQVRLCPLEEHDSLTQDFWERVGASVIAVSEGSPPTDALKAEVRQISHASVDEGAGEGFHRSTNHEKLRAPGSTITHLKRDVRAKPVIKDLREFMEEHGAKARAVVRYEWDHWQRILQTEGCNLWVRRRMHPQLILKRLYREDSRADEDWSAVLQRVQPNRPVMTEELTTREALQREWLAATFQKRCFYSVKHQVQHQNEAGRAVVVQQQTFFEVVDVQHGSHRDKTMHTVLSADDPLKVYGLALLVHMLDRYERLGEDDCELRVYHETEALWVHPSVIAPFAALETDLVEYRRVDADPAIPRTFVLSDAHRACPRMPLTDITIPTLELVNHLRRHGWISHPGHVTHVAVPLQDDPTAFVDCREAIRMKPYYMCVHQLSRVLPLSGGGIPSQQPVTYYKCLLRGDRTVANLGAIAYTKQWNRGSVEPGQLEPFPIAGPGVPAPVTNGEDFDVHPAGWHVPVAKARSGVGPRGGRGGARGSGRGAGRGPHGVPPPPLPLPAPAPEPGVPGGGGAGPGGDGGANGGGGEGGGDHDGDEDFEPPPAVPRVVRADRPTFQPGLDGAEIVYDNYLKANGVFDPNWRLRCTRHVGCIKRRGAVRRFERRHGVIEPAAFLHAWHLMVTPSKPSVAKHTLDEPTDEEVDVYVAEHAAELRELVQRCMEI